VRLGWVLLAALAGACSEAKVPPARGLRVPLPDGWTASPGASGVLKVGPGGRGVATLERSAAPLPSMEALKTAVEAEGAVVASVVGAADSRVLRYSREGRGGLLVVRTLEPGVLLLCATTPEVAPEELEATQALCGKARLEAVGR